MAANKKYLQKKKVSINILHCFLNPRHNVCQTDPANSGECLGIFTPPPQKEPISPTPPLKQNLINKNIEKSGFNI